MKLASCLLTSALAAIVWHASPINGEKYLRASGTDAVGADGPSDNGIPKSISKAGMASRVSPEAKALRMLSVLHGHGGTLKFGSPFLSLSPPDASTEQVPDNQRDLAYSNFRVAQRYYVPLKQEELIAFFHELDPVYVELDDPIENFIGISVLIDNTVLIWDHHEDGFDDEVNPEQNSTQVWGNLDYSDGAPPGCTNNSCDVLNSDTSIVVSNAVPTDIPDNETMTFYFDGGDKVLTSGPITMTRGAFPLESSVVGNANASYGIPGTHMEGATEVFTTTWWGNSFEAPVGQNIPIINNTGRVGAEGPFEVTHIFVMADTDNTEVTLTRRNGTIETKTIGNGQSTSFIHINFGDKLNSSNLVQVHLLTGDVGAQWEMRWYTLLAVELWSDDYYSPVGMNETTGSNDYFRLRQSFVWLYNPNPFDIIVFVETTSGTANETVPASSPKRTGPIPTNSGVHVYTDRRTGGGKFFALTQTDSAGEGANPSNTGGRNYDWGHPLIPTIILSEQVLVGIGWGCPQQRDIKVQKCPVIQSLGANVSVTSVVWVTPVKDATIYVDYNNDGVAENITNVTALSSIRYSDPIDDDMSGARIWAVKQGDPPDSIFKVKIAAAWGEDPSLPEANGGTGLDAGTVIPPTGPLSVGKGWELGFDANNNSKVNYGDQVVYAIGTENVRTFLIRENTLTVFDTNDPYVTYVNRTAEYFIKDGPMVSGKTQIPDKSTSPFFPLDPSFGGFSFNGILKLKQVLFITYNVTINNNALPEVINRGYSRFEGVNYTFNVKTPVYPLMTE